MIKIKNLLCAPFKMLWGYIWSKTDVPFKKMCLLASLHASIRECDERNIKELKALNNSLKLVKDVNAMRLPILLGPLLWSNNIQAKKLDTNQEKTIVKILRKLPCWIKYSDDDTISRDIKSLFEYYKQVDLKNT